MQTQGRLAIRYQGEVKPIETVEQLHQWLKLRYNFIEIVDKETGEVSRMPCSTTELNDRDFIGKYMQQIEADFATEYYVEFCGYQEWIEMHNDGSWWDYKKTIGNV